tara:strand:+ start:148 stop:852 length:705 start_codon:yes stop_codon:yes gene_type:complete
MINKVGFLLVKPQLPENIGFCARGLKNFGFKNLHLVNPKESWPNKKAIATSVGAKDILKKTKVYFSIKDAINRYDVVYASSARRRDINKRHLSFNQFIKSIQENKKKKIGIIFGPEASGLSNEDIAHANYIFKIPVNNKFESINLSHSVILVCYEIFRNFRSSYFKKEKKLTDIVSKKKVNTFVNFIEGSLEKKGFFSPNEKKKTMLMNLRNIFGRMQLSNKELRILSSVFSNL